MLFVCTGNICRSAYAEHGLSHRLRGAGLEDRIAVGSRGTHPNQALTVPRPLVRRGLAQGITGLEDHRPAPLDRRAVEGADLIITATADHLDLVLRESPTALKRTFTMLEIGTLLPMLDEQTDGSWLQPGMGVSAMSRVAAQHRSQARSALNGLDLADPFGKAEDDYLEMASTLEPILDVLTDALDRVTRPQTTPQGSNRQH